MSLERLVDEIRHQAEAEVARERERFDSELKRIADDRDLKVEALRAESARQTDLEVARDRAQRLARAKLEARKKVFGARERRMVRLLGKTRDVLTDFVDSDEYGALLKRLFAYAVAELGKSVRVSGRAEDATRLKTLAGKGFVATPRPILGGMVVESADGARRLNLSLDELLRLREDRVRALLYS